MGTEDSVHNGACADASFGRSSREPGFNKVLERKEVTPDTVELRILNREIAKYCHPGQFVIVRGDEAGERIPLTIADFNREAGTITLVIQKVGDATIRLGDLKKDEQIRDIAGPLGHHTDITNFGTVVVIGGGLGIAPAYPIQRGMKEAGNRVISIIGARAKQLLFWEEKMRSCADDFYMTTDDGSAGEKGFATTVLKRLIDSKVKLDRVIAIGPPIMMKAVADTTRGPGIKTVVSLNPIMVDGTGMCGGCRIDVGGKTKFACVDGPEFDAHETDFDLLMSRLATYKDVERKAAEQHGK
jgi:NAD(P)H-flavin reductase